MISRTKAGDTVIIGGGLAGLSASILLARKGHSVLLLEKDSYPQHKVCGEYISMESWDFLNTALGLDLNKLGVSRVTQLAVTSPKGKEFRQALSPGGFGISRFELDNSLKNIAAASGVTILQNAKAETVEKGAAGFVITTNNEIVHARTVLAAFGKRSNLDVKWQRPFAAKKAGPLNNYVGVKYHVRGPFEKNEVALHNFHGGYCGICPIEEEKFNLCYLVKASVLREAGNNIRVMEWDVLFKNPHLKKVFMAVQFESEKPATIAQVSFMKKTAVEKGALCIGDAGGMITPLCGNGMSIALHCGKLAAEATSLFLNNAISRREMEQRYSTNWQKNFGGRLKTGRIVQSIVNNSLAAELFISTMNRFPNVAKTIIDRTHGDTF